MSESLSQHRAPAPAETAADGPAISTPAAVGFGRTIGRHWPALTGGIVVLVAVAWLTYVPRQGDLSPVLNGRRFPVTEQQQAQQTLRDAGLNGSQFVDGRLLVPRHALAASNQALSAAQTGADHPTAIRSTLGTWLEPFTTSRRQRTADEAARAAHLSRLLAELAGVESAEVLWDEEPGVGRRQAPRVRATVFLKPEPGATIGFDTVQAVRVAVSGSRAHLSAEDVLVLDLQRRIAYGPETDSAVLSAEQRRAELTAACQSRIDAALSSFTGVQATVSLDAARPSPPTGHARIAGVSGPNLRLEVAQSLDVPAAAWQRTAATELPHLVVAVVVPAECLSSQSIAFQGVHAARPRSHRAELPSEARRLTIENEIRQRVAHAVSGLPVTLNLSRLNIAWTPTDTNHARSTEPSAGPAPRIDVGGVSALARGASAFLREHPRGAGAGLIVGLGCAAGLKLRRRNRARRAPERRASPPNRSAAPLEFLPGINRAAWAPLIALEPTPVIAGLLRRLSPDDVAVVIASLTPVQQRDVLELAPGRELGPLELAALQQRLRLALHMMAPEQPASDPANRPAATGPVIRRSPQPRVFDDLIRADEDSLRKLTTRVPPETWSAALVGASPKLQRRLSRLSLAIHGRRDRSDRRPIRLREIESAQRMIIDEWQTLEVHGESNVQN